MLWYLEEFVSISKMPGWVGWDGKGREVMGWKWGWGEVCHVEEVRKVQHVLLTNRPLALLWHPFGSCRAAFGSLGAPVSVPFYYKVGADAFFDQSSKKMRKPNKQMNQHGCHMTVFLTCLSAGKQ